MSELTEVLKATREFLTDPNHWKKGPTTNHTKCLVNAVWDAGSSGDVVEYLDAMASERGFPDRENGGLRPAAAFNDAPETTHADVLAFLDLAIKRAEASEEIKNENR
jgi:hypothetical protein